MTGPGDNAWRAVIAALANDATRQAYARLVLGASAADAVVGLAPSRGRAAIAQLLVSGLVVQRDGEVSADGVALRGMLHTDVARKTGIDRYLRADGRIDRYPTRADERLALLEDIAAAVLPLDEVVTEPQLNERLAACADDVALLRRQLVDHGILERTPSGSQYALVPRPDRGDG